MPKKLLSPSREQVRNPRATTSQVTPQAEAAAWLLRLMQKKDSLTDDGFLKFAWCCSDIKKIVKSLQEEVDDIPPRQPACAVR